MNRICLGVWYIVFTACAIISLVIRLIRSFNVAIKEMVFYILIAAIIYGGYMLIFVIWKKEDKDKEVKISNEDSNLIRDQLFKYLFTLAVGGIFLSLLIKYLKEEFAFVFTAQDAWYDIMEKCCSQFIVPIIIVVDVFMIPRRRVPKPMFDLIVLLVIIVLFHVLALIYTLSFQIAIASFLKSLIFSFDGYILYDFILHKKTKSAGGYHLLDSSASSSPSEKKNKPMDEQKDETKANEENNKDKENKK